jgi:hypothetical protein
MISGGRFFNFPPCRTIGIAGINHNHPFNTPRILENNIGGGLLLSGYAGSMHLVNNTIVDNTAEAVDVQGPSGNGGGIVIMTETDSWGALSATLRNCIVNNNQVTSNGSNISNLAGDISNAIVASTGLSLDIDYCNYQALRSQDGAVAPLLGSHNLTAPPGFSLEMPYYLARSSVCVDTGDNDAAHMPATDLDGQPRPQDGDNDGTAVTNMGCYEQVFADPFPWNLFLPAITRGNK